MKPIMRKRFVPNHYNREVYNRLQSLSQGSKTVNEYFKKIKITIIRANISKDREVTFARFLIGLNKDIANVVELQYYLDRRYGVY
jgi:hypothetical protein